MNRITVRVVGGSHHAMKEVLDEGGLETEVTLSLTPEPDNKYDANAVKVFVNEKQVGYISGHESAYVSMLIKSKRVESCKVKQRPANNNRPTTFPAEIVIKPLEGDEKEEAAQLERDQKAA